MICNSSNKVSSVAMVYTSLGEGNWMNKKAFLRVELYDGSVNDV